MKARDLGVRLLFAILPLLPCVGAAEAQGGGGATTPGSCIASDLNGTRPIPDGKKWYPVQIGTSHPNAACPGRNVQMVELRGWIHGYVPPVGPNGNPPPPPATVCNEPDPDWHYYLEVDSSWAASQGINLSQLIRVGDIAFEAALPLPTVAPEQAYATPTVELELWGWRPSDHAGQSLPTGWAFTTADAVNCPGVSWPFEPFNPSGQSPLGEGKYVRVVGSLVTDEPHEHQAALESYTCRNFGVFCSYNGNMAQTDALAMDWGNGMNDQATDPARWTEIHPPDLIEVLPDPGNRPGYKETFRGVTVLSENCLVGQCGAQTFDADIAPPIACPRGTQFGYQELVGTAPNETNFATIVEGNGPAPGTSTGAQITVGPGSIHVHVMVRGKSANGAYGRFKALYRVYCFVPGPPPPMLVLNVQRGSDVRGKWVFVTAKDNRSGGPVNANVTYGLGTLRNARIAPGGSGASGTTGVRIYYGACMAEIIIPPTLHTPPGMQTSPCLWEVTAPGYPSQTFN